MDAKTVAALAVIITLIVIGAGFIQKQLSDLILTALQGVGIPPMLLLAVVGIVLIVVAVLGFERIRDLL